MLDLRPVTLSEIARDADAAAVLVTEHGWDDLSACQFRDDLAVGLARDPSRADDPDAAKERVLSSVGQAWGLAYDPDLRRGDEPVIRDVLDLDLGWDELSDHADRMARSATTVVAPALDSDGLYSDDVVELAAEVNRGEPDDDPDGQWDAKVDALYRVHATVRDAYDRAVDEWGEQGGYAATVVLEPSEVGQWQTVHNADRVDRPVLPPKGWEGRGSFLLMDATDVGHLAVEAWDDPAVAEAVAAATADATPEVV